MNDRRSYRVSAFNRRGTAAVELPGSRIEFDGTPGSSGDVPGPAELFAASFAACTLKNVERFSQTLPFAYREAHIEVTAVREVGPPRIAAVHYRLLIDTDEPDRRIDLLRRNIEKFGTVYNTIAAACEVVGTVGRADPKVTP